MVQFWKNIPRMWRLAGLGLLLLLGLVALIQGRPSGHLQLYFLDVGQGNAILLVTPSGQRVLIDGGPDATALLSRLGRRLPFWERGLDMVLLTETDPERMAGPVAVLERYRVEAAGRPDRVRAGPGWERWQSLLEGQGVVALPLQAGALLDLGDGIILEVLHPREKALPGVAPGGRDDALVLRLRYGRFSALLPTAAGPVVQEALLDSGLGLESTLLLVPRQAEHEALSPQFLAVVWPAIVVVSSGTGYHQGVDARTLELIRAFGSTLYRTDRQGTIELLTDGEEVEVRVGR